MFCTNCGTRLPDDAQFCSRCGRPTPGANASSPEESGGSAVYGSVLPANTGASRARGPRYTHRRAVSPQTTSSRSQSDECFECGRTLSPGGLFCPWCTRYQVDAQEPLYLAGLFRRWFANVVDCFAVFSILYVPLVISSILSRFNGLEVISVLLIITSEIAIIIGYFFILAHGTTFGKIVMRIQVIRTDGEVPGFWTMMLREVIGKALSLLFLNLGYLWAIWDRDRQSWHDKMAGTVVVHRRIDID